MLKYLITDYINNNQRYCIMLMTIYDFIMFMTSFFAYFLGCQAAQKSNNSDCVTRRVF